VTRLVAHPEFRVRFLNPSSIKSISTDVVVRDIEERDCAGASRIELEFPQGICERETVRAIRYGGTWDRLLL